MKKKQKAAGPLKDLYRQSACQANQLAVDIFTAANTSKSLEMSSLLSSGDYLGIVSASISPKDYGPTNVDTFSRDYLCVEMMSKFPTWELGIDRAAVATQKFFDVEGVLADLSFVTNPKLVVGRKSATMVAVIETARHTIAKIIGDPDLNEIHSFFAFGPGASTSLSRRRGDAAYKFGAQRPQLTYNAIPLADALVRAHPTWRFDAEVVGGSKLITVPKNAKTDRTICVEPDLNMYFQKGIGRVIRRRLNRWGLLKKTAQEYNQELAREGSAYGRLATVDLSSASDSVHLGLVHTLLPPLWVDLVELTRSPQVILPSGESHLLRKVSSMGNGFTFELETLIFYGLCRAVIDLLASRDMDHRCTVFGDDIIIDKELVPVLVEVLAWCGFTTNTKKTFYDGPFRESCGKHYFHGIDVTPFYIRAPLNTVLRKYWAANTVRRYARLPWGLDLRYKPVYDRLVSSIPNFFRDIRIPDGVGDGGLICDWDEARPSRNSRGHESWKYEDIVAKNRNLSLDDQGTLLKCLHRLEFPRGVHDVDQLPIDQLIGVINAFVTATARSPMTSCEKQEIWNDIVGLDGMIAVESGLGKRGHGVVPVSSGHKLHIGYAQQWPSFGPWI